MAWQDILFTSSLKQGINSKMALFIYQIIILYLKQYWSELEEGVNNNKCQCLSSLVTQLVYTNWGHLGIYIVPIHLNDKRNLQYLKKHNMVNL